MIKSKDKKKNDLLLGAVLLLTATVLFLGQHVFRKRGAVQVLVKDEEFGTYSLSEDQEIPIGEGNILAISGGEAL
ncbi:MAG: hypothetical protein ACLS5R_07980 [Blautia sp.]